MKNTEINFLQPTRAMAKKGETLYNQLPLIDHGKSMANFRRAVGAYNETVNTQNIAIQAFNDNIEKPTPLKEQFVKLFLTKHKNIKDPAEWNVLVDEFSYVHGNFIKKKKLKTIKPGLSTEIFSALLYEYQLQIQRINEMQQKCGITRTMPLPKLSIHPGEITSRLREGYHNLSVSNKTIYNYRLRFQAAGILQDYEFHSHRRPVDISINPEILTFFSPARQKTEKIENQSFTVDRWKILQHNNVVPGTLQKNNKKKANVNNHSTDKEVRETENNTKSTNLQTIQKTTPEKKTNQAAVASDNLRAKIVDIWQLCQELAAGKYFDHEHIPLRRWEYELQTGNLSPEEFRICFFQDFFKYSSKLWKNTTASAGSWYLAIKDYMEHRFVTFTGHCFDKNSIYKYIPEYYWRINSAARWFTKKEWNNVLFPNIYFDITRKDPELIGFEYTANFWKKNEAAKNKAAVKRKMIIEKNSSHAKNLRKINQVVKKYIRHQVTLKQVYDFVINNCGKEYIPAAERRIYNSVNKFKINGNS